MATMTLSLVLVSALLFVCGPLVRAGWRELLAAARLLALTLLR